MQHLIHSIDNGDKQKVHQCIPNRNYQPIRPCNACINGDHKKWWLCVIGFSRRRLYIWIRARWRKDTSILPLIQAGPPNAAHDKESPYFVLGARNLKSESTEKKSGEKNPRYLRSKISPDYNRTYACSRIFKLNAVQPPECSRSMDIALDNVSFPQLWATTTVSKWNNLRFGSM